MIATAGPAGRSRRALLGGVGFAALLMAMPSAALADDLCNIVGDTVTCTGDVSDGISLNNSYVTLNVNSLTTNITPASGTTGIRFNSDGPIHVTTDTGTFSINATGTDAHGIYLSSTGLGDPVSLNETGNINSALGKGIWLQADGPVSEIGNGNVHSGDDAIYAHSNEAGGIVNHTGNLTSDNGYGIYAAGQGSVQVSTNGVVQSELDGVHAYSNAGSPDGTVVVSTNGNITSDFGYGIWAEADFHSVGVTNVGDIVSASDGIHARTRGQDDDASTTVHQTGSINSGGNGIDATSDFHSVSVTVDGENSNISAGGTGIYLRSNGSADDSTSTLNLTGNVISAGDRGIDVTSAYHSASATVDGNVNSTGDGIYIRTVGWAGDASSTLNLTGNVLSTGGYGVYVESSYHSASATITGNVQGNSDAIYVRSEGSDGDSSSTVSVTGNVTSTGGYGVYAESAYHSAGVTVVGDVNSVDDGIYVRAEGSGSDSSAHATVEGDVTSSAGRGIYAESAYHDATVDSTGDISSYYEGIYAKSTGSSSSNTFVDQTGDVTSSHGQGIFASSIADTSQVIVHSGNIDGNGDGVHVEGLGSNTRATATITGNVKSTNGDAIYVYSANRDATGTLTGNITNAAGNGLDVESYGVGTKATATLDGDVTTNGKGVYVYAANGTALAMVNGGTINSGDDGVFVESLGSSNEATALVYGDSISSVGGYGVFVRSTNGKASEVGTGTVYGYVAGILVTSESSNSDVLVSHTGNVSSANSAIVATAANGTVDVVVDGDIVGGSGGINAATTSANKNVNIGHTGTVNVTTGLAVSGYSAGGQVNITQAGNVTGGTNGLLANSKSKDVHVVLNSGTVSGATESAVKLMAINGATFANYGEVDGGSGKAITSKDYKETYISNYGTVSGAVYIDDLAGGFTNFADSVYNITDLNFVNGGFLSNSGLVSPGRDNNAILATLEGRFVQDGDGTLLVDIDGNSSDKLAVTDYASLDGALKVNFVKVGLPNITYTVLTSDQLIDQNLTVQNGLVWTGDINYVNGTDVTLGIAYDFGVNGLNANESAVGNALNQAYGDGTPALGTLLANLANINDLGEYAEAMDQLSPEIYSDIVNVTASSASSFSDKLLSCRVYDGAYSFNAEGECAWISGSHSDISRSQTAELQGFDQTGNNVSMGVQKSLGGDLRVGFGLGYTTTEASNTAGASVNGEEYQGGVVVKYDHEAFTFAAALSAGRNNISSERPVVIGNFVDDLTGDGEIDYISGRLRGAYTMQMGSAYIKPLADFDLTNVNFHGFDEAGGVAALDISDSTQLTATFSPAVEFGTEAKLGDTIVARPYVRVGAEISSGSQVELTSAFDAASGDTFRTTSGTDALMGTIDVGVDVIASNNASLRLFYDGAFGDTTSRQAVGLKLAAPL